MYGQSQGLTSAKVGGDSVESDRQSVRQSAVGALVTKEPLLLLSGGKIHATGLLREC